MRASTPSHGRSDTAAPPTSSRRSRRTTERPARASIAAATSPLWPPPTIHTSYTVFSLPSSQARTSGDVTFQGLEQLRVRLARRVGDRRVRDLAVDDVDALGQPRVLARSLRDARVGHVEDVRHRRVG